MAVARRNVAAALRRDAGLPVYIRVDHDDPEIAADLDALVPAAGAPLLADILLPKAGDGSEVAALDRVWRRSSARAGAVPGHSRSCP